jgi:hypothetical protein
MTDCDQNQEAAVQRKEVLVIRIGVSIEGMATAEQVADPSRAEPTSVQPPPPSGQAAPEAPPARPPRFHGRDTRPTEARQGDARAMSDSQRKLLFRLAFSLGDRDGALDRVLEALGVGRLEWATRAHASKAIDALEAEAARRPSDRPTNGGRHA